MTKVQMNLQDSFLNAARRQNVPVTVALTDGSKIKGKVNGFDNFTVILDDNKIQYLIYKHAIATIFPERPLEKHMNMHSHGAPSVEKGKPNVSPNDLEKFKATMESK
jgi:host factor-I protein